MPDEFDRLQAVMPDVLVRKIDLLLPVLLGAGDFDDGHCGSFDELHVVDVLLHFLLLQDELDLSKQSQRVQSKLLVLGGDGDIDV